MLLPGENLHILRPIFLLGCVTMFTKARNIINAGNLAVILKPLKEEGRLKKSSGSLAGEAIKGGLLK